MEATRFHKEFYKIKGIGKGAYGTVFSCMHKLDGQAYAVKIVKFNRYYDQDKVLREVKALAKCNHSNVVRYFNAWIEWMVVQSSDEDEDDDKEGDDDGASSKSLDAMLFIQMEHCHQNLDNLLEQSTITEGTALKYFQGMVKGLDHIHGKKIIHGDLSRKNIFIDANKVIKVADFGLAKLLGNSATAIKSGSSGTKSYLAPEAEKGAPIDQKVDIYSLGILFLELLGSFTTMSERAHAINNLREMRVLPESISKYEDYILQLVAFSPEERPSTKEILTWPIWADVSSSEAENDDRVPIRTGDDHQAADDDMPGLEEDDDEMPKLGDDKNMELET
ncbi:serine/threonine-protein kinase ifkC isoform X2 [Populus alba x Populus x berolinensis]|nr:serine/threonine-protein kinase ifkC isoform X2 [Populus alba x Populus x berolinensis]